MRTKAFGEEPPDSLLTSQQVARESLSTLVSRDTGHVIDIRRDDPLSSHLSAADVATELDGRG
jgi:2-C-methyl-D-erythritol 4-phosphate cytidylyltransferase